MEKVKRRLFVLFIAMMLMIALCACTEKEKGSDTNPVQTAESATGAGPASVDSDPGEEQDPEESTHRTEDAGVGEGVDAAGD